MEAFIYLSKSIAILSIFYLIYFIFFRKDTLFTAKRHFFLAGIIAALVLPFVTFTKTVYKAQPIVNEIDFSLANLVPAPQVIQNIGVETSFNWWPIIYAIYGIGFIIFLTRFFVQLISLAKVLKSKVATKKGKYLFIETTENIAPFSFFNYIVFNPEKHTQEELQMILHHEKTHASQWHSIDLIAANLIRTIQWINPFSWFYKKSLEENLEFIADNQTVAQVASKKQYQLTLVKASSPLVAPGLTSQFYQSFIKKRIIMLNKNTSQKRNLWKLSLVLPFLCFFLWSFNVKEKIAYISPENNINTLHKEFSILPTTTKAEINAIEAYFKDNNTTLVKIKNLKRDKSGHIISFNFQTKFKGQDQFYTRFTQAKAPNTANYKYTGHTIQYSDGALNVSEIGPKATKFKITQDRLVFLNQDYVTPNKEGIIEKAIIISSEISEDQLNAIELQLENQSEAFEIDFKDRKRNAEGQLIELSIDTKYNGQPRYYKNVTYGGKQSNKAIATLQLQVIDKQLHFGNTDGSMQNKITANGVVALVFPKKEKVTHETLKMGANPLYIINGKEYYKADLPINTNFEVSDSIELLYPKEAIKKYGNKAKDGLLIFKGVTTFKKDEVEIEQETPKEIKALITKNAPASVFKKIKKELMDQHGVELRYIDQRNALGEINNLEFYFFENDIEIGTLGLGLYNPAPIETSTFFYSPSGRFNFWNATKEAKLKKTQAEKDHYSEAYLNKMESMVPASFKIKITKNTTDQELEVIKANLKENHNVEFAYAVTRNSLKQIIALSITHSDTKGNNGAFKIDDTEPIEDLIFYKTPTGFSFGNATEIKKHIKQHQKEIEHEEEKELLKHRLKEHKNHDKAHHKISSQTNHDVTVTQNGGHQTIYHLNDSDHEHTYTVTITKNTSNAALEKIKKDLATKGTIFSYKRLKRNKAGEITRIKIEVDNKKGSKQNVYSKTNSDDPIENILIKI